VNGYDFFTGNWYDIYPVVYMDECAAKLCGKSMDAFLKLTCEMQAKLDMNGVYRMILGFVSPETALKRMTGFSGQYFNFGKHELVLGEKKANIVTTGSPLHIGDWFCKALGYYVSRVIIHAGATEVKSTFGSPEPGGVLKDVQMCTVRWQMEWESK